MADKKRTAKEIIDEHSKALAEAHAAGDQAKVQEIVDSLPLLGRHWRS